MSNNKSIFNYVVNSSMYVNDNQCNNYTPPFLAYMPGGIQAKNVNIENDLKGITRAYSKCQSSKYQPGNPITFDPVPECETPYKIVHSYIPKN